MEPTDVLATIAELAVAFAGFSGIVSALGRHEQGAVFPEDRVRLAVLIGSSPPLEGRLSHGGYLSD